MRRTALGILAGLALGWSLAWGTTPAYAPTNEVAVFNDGFAEAKQDDCDQGSEAACQWVMIQNDIPLPPEGEK
ncbi:hypothetical protein PV708_02625 [Streptomyces sp. ME02-6977A]|uniref:hypothetical protein n=1 Tax=Streptomyces sp. ME02-6977A TaxID=3028671 RepID=UPI0029BA7252|nr:hypothetical protein [Streptomyces sp. ME02-6977A]MDX3405135.1 hypothetical protein [Streptomyces sp. ME02-6977A]